MKLSLFEVLGRASERAAAQLLGSVVRLLQVFQSTGLGGTEQVELILNVRGEEMLLRNETLRSVILGCFGRTR